MKSKKELLEKCLKCSFNPDAINPDGYYKCFTGECIAKAINKEKWINVKDKEPEFDELVLVYTDANYICIRYLEAIVISSKCKNYIWREGGDPAAYNDVTHWMLLPEKPITKKEN
jgi:hypothetical protein